MTRFIIATWSSWMIVAALAALATGCGTSSKRTYPVQGEVRFQNKPAAGALVIFTPSENANRDHWPMGYPRGTVQDDGSFKLTTYRPDDGAPPGTYAITIIWVDTRSDDTEATADLLEGRYADPSASRIRVEIKSDRSGLTLEPFNLE